MIVLTFLAGASAAALARGTQKVAVRPVHRSIPMQAIASGGLTVSVVNLATNAALPGATAGTPALDLGRVSYSGSHTADVAIEQRKNSFTVSTAFGLLVQDSSHQAGYAAVSAFVAGANPQITYSIDARKLTSTPTIVVPRVPVGGTSKHNLRVEIPTSLTERSAQQQVAIEFEVTPN